MTKTMAFVGTMPLLVAFHLPSKAQQQPCKPSQVRVAVVHAEDENGEQHLPGVRKALAELDPDKRVCVVPKLYRDDGDGTRKLVDAITQRQAEIILGSTARSSATCGSTYSVVLTC